jgi:hypothetical protein
MKCKILNDDNISKIYTVQFPDNTTGVYHKNIGRNCFVGKKSDKYGIVDVYYFSKLLSDSVELEPVQFFISENGYTNVIMRSVEKESTEWLHKIVAFSWCEKPVGSRGIYLEVDHINSDKQDNRPENLRYLSPLVNSFKEWHKGNPNGKRYLMEHLEGKKREMTSKEFLFGCKQLLELYGEDLNK